MRHLRNRKGQGTTEYIVIIALAIAVAIGVFWGQLKGQLTGAVTTIGNSISAQASKTVN